MIRTVRMTHPDVVLPIDVPDDPAVIAVHEESGWNLDPLPDQTNAALAAVQVAVPEPVKPAKARSKTAAKPDQTDPSD